MSDEQQAPITPDQTGDEQERGSLNQEEVVIYSFLKSNKEEIRISETTYLNRKFIDIRVFSRKADGTFTPTKKGITFSKDVAKCLIEGFKKIKFDGQDSKTWGIFKKQT